MPGHREDDVHLPMNSRIQRALDGELPADALTQEEARDLRAVKSCIDTALLAVPRERMPDLGPAVLARIAALDAPAATAAPAPQAGEAGGWRALVAWFWRPRPIELAWRPAYGVGVALMVLVTGGSILGRDTAPVVAGVQATATAQHVLVQFRLDAPDAREVALAGDFTEWQPMYSLRRTARGAWTVVAPLAPGIHDYAFIIDGERWVPDPMAPAVDDGFGGLNSRVAVMTPDGTERSL